MEVWGALGYISFELPDTDIDRLTLKQLSQDVMKLKNEFLKKREI